MFQYCIRRILQMIPTVFGVILLTFILFNIVPNDLAAIALGKNVTPMMLESFDEQRGLNRPLFFGKYASTRAHRDIDFKNGSGNWKNESIIYNRDDGYIRIKDGCVFNPLSFELSSDYRYVWRGTFRGVGSIGSSQLSSEKWSPFRVELKGSEINLFLSTNNFSLRNISLRRVQSNIFDSQLSFYLAQLLRGDFGQSSIFKQPVSKLLKDGIWPSLSLSIPIFIIGLASALVLSLLCAYFRNQFIDRFIVIISVALMSINYLIYIVAGQYFLAYKFDIFPVWGFESIRYLFLPVVIGVISGLGSNVRFYRTIMLDEIYQDYVRTALSKGVSKTRILFVHVLRNALIPIVTNVVIAIPFLYTGNLLLENFFGIPGLGYLGINAILSSDVDVVRALVLIAALLFVLANLLTDIVYAIVDPRVTLK